MKRLLCLGMLAIAGSGGAAVLPIFINDSPLVLPDAGLPTINASAFVNKSTITVSSFTLTVGVGINGFGFNSAATLPFETFGTLYYTNEETAVMSGSPGFRFLTTQSGVRRPAKVFVNQGDISGTSYLEVKADNIISTGPLDTSEAGLIRLTGKSADLTRTRLRSGQAAGVLLFSGGQNNSPRPGQYQNAFGVTDSYWGVGTNGSFLGNGRATRVNTLNFNLPDPSTPLHQNEYLSGRRLATNRVSLPKFNFFGTNFSLTNFAAFVYNSNVDGTAALVQVVFVRTNGPDGNFSANVTFAPFAFEAEITGPSQPMVELRKWDFDPSLDLYITNAFYLSDSMAILTNLNLFRNVTPGVRGGRRPNVYEFQTSPTFNWPGVAGNGTFTNGMLDNTGYLSNQVSLGYAGYAATVFTNALSGLSSPFGLLAGSIVPTNLAGRVEVASDQLNLDSTRIRAESTVLVRTKDLQGNQLARLVDAPLVGMDVTSKQPELVISNLALPAVQRLSGMVCAWSGYWRNQQIDPVTMRTNDVHFHVLFVDHNLQPTLPVQVFQFAAHATNLVIADQVNLFPSGQAGFGFASDPVRGRKFLIEAQSVDIRGGLSLPVGSSWAKTNVVGVVNFTNSGNLFVPGAAKYGTDRTNAYNWVVNSGTNNAASQLVRARNFLNSGNFVASGSLVQIDAGTARIEGPGIVAATNITPLLEFTNIGGIFVIVTNGYFTNIAYSSLGASLQAYNDIQITAGTLSFSNSLLAAGGVNPSFFFPGRLLLTVTNRLTDAGPDSPNFWNCSGFELRRRPTAGGDLLGTRLDTSIGINQLKTHIWAAQDLGAVAQGFTNNQSLGILGVNISTNNGRAVFRSASGRQAIYVDYLELFHDATNFNRTISINPNFTIYFANANVPVSKLDGANNGRFQWVSSFAGPNSSTNLTYPSGNTYTFNIALVQNTDLDSDGDGIPNADDPTPIYVAEDAALTVALLAKLSPPRAMLSWNALAFSTNTVEFKDAPSDPHWRVLTNFVHGPFTAPVQLQDPITGADPTRVYRLRVSPATRP